MDTTKIYSYLAILKTGCCDALDNFRLRVIQSEIDFRASFTQFMTEGNGKGANLILNDYMDLKETLSKSAKEDSPFHEQYVYSLTKTKEAIDYIKKTIKMYASDELPQQETSLSANKEVKKSDERVISGTEGLRTFLGCSKSLAFAVIKDGVLIENGIQYKVGNCWKFNAKKLEEFIEIHPRFLENIHCIR